MQGYVGAVEASLATGKWPNAYNAIADARNRALVQFDARVVGTPLANLLAHVPTYRSVQDLGPVAGRCAVTGVESAKLRAIRFDAATVAGTPPAMCCELCTAAFRGVRFYYAVYYWTELTTWLLWRGELDVARHAETWSWLLGTLAELAVFVGR